jgi:hypothetical protein
VEHESVGDQSPAEQLPAIYRAVLDSVAELERRGERLEASQFRDEAIRAYSRAWDGAGRRRLLRILRGAERLIAVTPEPAPELELAPELAAEATDVAPSGTGARKRRVATTA